MHLLQVCNVGNICGGTAACAWTISRALGDWRHTVVFRSRPTPETLAAFAHCRVETWPAGGPLPVPSIPPDVVLLHNLPARVGSAADAPVTVQYLHSRIDPAPADVTVACSRWLAAQHPQGWVDGVLYQPVPRPPRPERSETRALRERLVVGRLCTPTALKWPPALVPFYARLAQEHPQVEWEFVGCPPELAALLTTACQGRVRFHPAGWGARQRLWEWDALLYHHPTLTESFGRTAAEAMRAGCIPLVDDRGGFREQVTPRTGFLCGSVADFSRALETLRCVRQRRALSRSGMTQAEGRFSLAPFRERFRRLLIAAATVVGGSPGRREKD